MKLGRELLLVATAFKGTFNDGLFATSLLVFVHNTCILPVDYVCDEWLFANSTFPKVDYLKALRFDVNLKSRLEAMTNHFPTFSCLMFNYLCRL